MFKVTDSCEYHRHLLSVAIIYRQLIFDRPSRLDDRTYPCVVCNFNTIWEREEGIASHDRSVEIETKTRCFFNRLSQCINPRSLSCTRGEELSILNQNNGVRFGVFANL